MLSRNTPSFPRDVRMAKQQVRNQNDVPGCIAIVAEVVVVVSSVLFSRFLNRSEQLKLDLTSQLKICGHGWEEATYSKRSTNKISYKDEKESYLDHSAAATHMKFEQGVDQE
jgi:hypothetical protein